MLSRVSHKKRIRKRDSFFYINDSKGKTSFRTSYSLSNHDASFKLSSVKAYAFHSDFYILFPINS